MWGHISTWVCSTCGTQCEGPRGGETLAHGRSLGGIHRLNKSGLDGLENTWMNQHVMMMTVLCLGVLLCTLGPDLSSESIKWNDVCKVLNRMTDLTVLEHCLVKVCTEQGGSNQFYREWWVDKYIQDLIGWSWDLNGVLWVGLPPPFTTSVGSNTQVCWWHHVHFCGMRN